MQTEYFLVCRSTVNNWPKNFERFMRLTHRVKKSLSTLLLSIQLFFSFFAPFLVFAPSARATELVAPQIEQVDSELRVSDYSGAVAAYYLADGQIMAQEAESTGSLNLFLGSQSGEDKITYDAGRLVVKTSEQTFYLTAGQVESSYASSDLALASADEDYLFNVWQVDGAVASTVWPVREGVAYSFPLNSQVQVRFNDLPSNPSALTIEEVSISSDLQADLGAISAVAYDVRTEMTDGEFSYDLILPKSEVQAEVAVKYAESLAELDQAIAVTETVDVEDKTVKVNDLNHMTLFIVVKIADLGITLPFDGPDDNIGDVWVYRASAGAVTSLVTDPTGSMPEQWRTEVVSMNAPGLGRSYLGYRGFSWETVASSNLKEISWYKYAADTANDHYLNFYIYQGVSKYGSVVIVPTCTGAGAWEQCSTNGVTVKVNYHYYSTSGWPWTWGWKAASQSFASLNAFMQSDFKNWSFYNDPETDASLVLISGSSTTSSDLLNYVDGIRLVYQDNSDDVYNFEAEVDLTRPTVSLSPVSPVLTNQAVVAVDIEFSEPVNDLLASELLLSNASVNSFSKIDARRYQVELLASADGQVTFQVPADVVFDNAGFGNEASELYSYTVDLTAPTQPTGMHILDHEGKELGCAGYTNNRSITVDWDDSSDSDFAYFLYDIKDKDGLKTLTVSQSSGDIRNLDGYYQYKVRAVDQAGNISVASDWCGVTLDRVIPTATIDGVAPKSLYGGDTNISVHAIDDNYLKTELYREGELSSFKTYTGAWFGLFWLSEGNYRMVVIDKAGNSSEYSFTIDKTEPTQPTDLQFINPDLACGAITNIKNITVDWADSSDHILGYDYKINYPLADGSGQADWQTFVTSSQRTGSLNEGTHYIQVRAKDVLNRYSAWSDVCSITYDSIAPVVALTSPLASLLRGTVEVRGSVIDANPHHYWLVIQNSAKQKVAGPGTVNDSSSFTNKLFFNWDTSSVADGDYTIKLEARDSANNKDASSVVWQDFTVDNTAPVSTISSPINTGNNSVVITNDWDGTITGTASDNLTGVDRVELSIDDGSGLVLVTASGNVNWTYTLPTAPVEGTYTISSHAIDNAGNRENTYTITIVYDKTIPEVNLTVNPVDPDGDNNWYITRPEVTLTATDDQDLIYGTDYIEYQWNSQTGTWTTYTAPILIPGEGQYVLYYRAWDKAGNVSEVGIKNLRFDETELSEGPFDVSADPNPTGGDTSLISWDAASDNTGINKYEVLWRLDGVQRVKTVAGDVLETEIDRLTEGEWRVIVRAFDGAGHSKEASIKLTVDRTAPAAPVLEITGQRPGEVDLSWAGVADASRYIVYYGLEAGNYLYAASVGNVTSYTVKGLTTGNYFFVVRAVDSSDNQSGNSNEVSILGLAGAVGGTAVAEGFQPAGEVQGVETEASEAEQEQMAKEIAKAGQVKGASIACTNFNRGLFWLFLILEVVVILLLAKFSKVNWLKILAFLVLPAIFSYIFARTNLAACYQASTMTWLAGHYYLPAYLTAMLAKMVEIFFFEE